jgi:hypothetical protein
VRRFTAATAKNAEVRHWKSRHKIALMKRKRDVSLFSVSGDSKAAQEPLDSRPGHGGVAEPIHASLVWEEDLPGKLSKRHHQQLQKLCPGVFLIVEKQVLGST